MHQYAILYHNYYSASGIQDIRRRIARLPGKKILLLCSLAEKFRDLMPVQRADERFLLCSNVGKDIGAKLLLIELLLTIGPDIPFALLLHDKKSYQKHSGEFEKESLFSIIDEEKFNRISQSFLSDKTLGIACCAGYRKSEQQQQGVFATTNAAYLEHVLDRYEIRPPGFDFVAGSMFWIRTSILQSFFSNHSTLEIRSRLEKGNPLDHEQGTFTHAWERALSWIATAAGFQIKEF